MFKAVIFDFDGTLVDSEWAYTITDMNLVKELGGDFSLVDYDNLAGSGVRNFIQTLIEKFDIKDRSIDELIELNDKLFIDIATDEVDVFPKMLELVKDLHHRKIPMAIASNTGSWVLDSMAQNTGMDRFVKHVYSADLVANDKPLPDLYLYTAAKLGLKPEECLVFEDSEIGVRSAVDAGMNVIWIGNESNKNLTLQKEVYRYIPDGHAGLNYREILKLI